MQSRTAQLFSAMCWTVNWLKLDSIFMSVSIVFLVLPFHWTFPFVCLKVSCQVPAPTSSLLFLNLPFVFVSLLKREQPINAYISVGSLLLYMLSPSFCTSLGTGWMRPFFHHHFNKPVTMVTCNISQIIINIILKFLILADWMLNMLKHSNFLVKQCNICSWVKC